MEANHDSQSVVIETPALEVVGSPKFRNIFHILLYLILQNKIFLNTHTSGELSSMWPLDCFQLRFSTQQNRNREKPLPSGA